MKIGIIDSGIDFRSITLPQNIKIIGKRFYESIDSVCIDDDIKDNIGHGTAVANIIIDGIADINETLELYILKIFEDKLQTSKEIINSALAYCLENKIKIINASFGFMHKDSQMNSICEKLYINGTIIVAAHDQKFFNVYPACFNSTLNVTAIRGSNYLKQGEYAIINDENKRYNLLAYGGKTRLRWIENRDILLEGVSFSCPRVVVIIAHLYQNNKKLSLDDIITYFSNFLSKTTISFDSLIKMDKPVGRIALFPFNKEMHSLIGFCNHLNIQTILDFRGRGLLGRKVNDILVPLSYSNNAQNICIKDVESNENINDYDSVLIGDLRELKKIYGKRIDNCLEFWISQGKQLYSFIPQHEILSQKIISPEVFNHQSFLSKVEPIQPVTAKMLNLTPIISIVGTSKSQGKFTLQMRLKNRFMEDEYVANVLSTEHQALLLETETAFPYGAEEDTLIDLSLTEFYEMYDTLLFLLSLKRGDVIITSLQSGIVTDLYSYRKRTLRNQILLNVMMPETCIAVINAMDPTKLIEKLIYSAQAHSRRKLSCIAIFNNTFSSSNTDKNANSISKLCESVAEKFNVPTYSIDDIEKIYRAVILTLSGK